MPPCPPTADLSAFLADALPPDAAAAVSAHVDGCPNCQTRLDDLTRDDGGPADRYRALSSVISVSGSGLAPVPPVPRAPTAPAPDPRAGSWWPVAGAAGFAVTVGLLGWAGLQAAHWQAGRDRDDTARRAAAADRTRDQARIARLEFEAAFAACDTGRPAAGLGRMVESLAAAEAAGDAGLVRVVRVNLAAWAAERTGRRGWAAGGPVTALAVSADGERTAAVVNGDAVTVWNTEDEMALHTFSAKPARLTAVALSPSGKRVAAGAADGSVRVWDDAPHAAPVPGGEPVTAVAFDGESAVWVAAGGAPVRRLDGGRVTAELRPAKSAAPVHALTRPAGGKRLYTGDAAGLVREWETDPPKEGRLWRLGTGAVADLATSADGRTLVFAGADGAGVIDLASGKVRHAIGLDGAAGVGVAVLPDGRFAVGDADGAVRVYDPVTGEPDSAAEHFGPPLAGVRPRPGLREYVVAAGSSVVVATPPKARPTDLIPDPAGRIGAIAYRPGGTSLLVAAGEQLREFDPKAGAARRSWPLAGEPLAVRFPAGGPDAEVQLRTGALPVNLDTGKVEAVQPSAPPPAKVEAADAGRTLTGLPDGTATLTDPAGKVLHTLPAHGGAVLAVGFSPDGSVLLTTGRDGSARTWDAATGLPLGPRRRHGDPVTAAAWSPTGDRVATGTARGLVRLWPAPPPPMTASVETLRKPAGP